MSRMACSGTGTSSRRRCPSGFRNIWTVTSFGMSWARTTAAPAHSSRTATTPAIFRSLVLTPRSPGFCPVVYWRPSSGPTARLSGAREGGRMRSQRHLWIAGAFLAVIVALGIGQLVVERAVSAQAKSGTQAPRFEVDPMWPRPLPNHWLLGSTIGVSVDAQDHVWIIHRSSATLNNNERGAELDPPTGECCKGAPPVLEFDQAGNLLRSWGGPGQGYEWPQSNHGITIDYKGNVWIGGNGADDGQVLKFTQDG